MVAVGIGCHLCSWRVRLAQRLGTSKEVVSRWRQRFSKLGLLGLSDEPCPGRPRTISDEQVQQVVNQVLQGKPDDASHLCLGPDRAVEAVQFPGCIGGFRTEPRQPGAGLKFTTYAGSQNN